MPDMQNMTASQKANYVQNLQALEGIPTSAKQMIAQEAIDSQKKITPKIYYSTIMFTATKANVAPGPYLVTYGQQDRKAFGYKEGDDMTSAGFVATSATRAETNLTSGGSQTNDNCDVVIWGLALDVVDGGPGGDGEIEALKAIFEFCWLEISLSSDKRDILGKMQDFPCGGGLYGAQASKLRQGSLGDERGALESNVTNGNPMAGNFWKLPLPLRWNAQGSRKGDTSLSIVAKLSQAISITTSADRTAAAGVLAFTVGTAAQLSQRVRIKLACVEIGPRSTNG